MSTYDPPMHTRRLTPEANAVLQSFKVTVPDQSTMTPGVDGLLVEIDPPSDFPITAFLLTGSTSETAGRVWSHYQTSISGSLVGVLAALAEWITGGPARRYDEDELVDAAAWAIHNLSCDVPDCTGPDHPQLEAAAAVLTSERVAAMLEYAR